MIAPSGRDRLGREFVQQAVRRWLGVSAKGTDRVQDDVDRLGEGLGIVAAGRRCRTGAACTRGAAPTVSVVMTGRPSTSDSTSRAKKHRKRGNDHDPGQLDLADHFIRADVAEIFHARARKLDARVLPWPASHAG